MRKAILLLTANLLAYTAFSQFTFTDATDNLQYGTLRSGAPMAVADMNGDGLDDIVCLDDRQFLYIEYQQADTSIFEGVYYDNLGSIQWSICVADADGNGYNDIFTGGQYNGLSLLFANTDGSDFQPTIITNPSIFLQGSNFVDINTDGYADIFACHDDAISVPFENDGNGNFTSNFNLISAVSTVPSDNSGNYGSVWTDYDNDRDLDLYITKCRLGVDDPTDGRRLNLLFQNDGDNNFEDVAAQANLLPFGQSWASDFGDIDNDGDLDCFIINHDIANSLYRNNGNGTFSNVSLLSGINTELSGSGLGMQIKFVDFDNDGFVDILYTSLATIHAVLHNNGDGTFTKVDNAFPIDERIHSATVGDLNNDGFMDVYAGYGFGYNQVSNQHDRLFLGVPNDNHYFKALLKGVSSNPNAIGARLEIYGDWGKQIREIRSGESYGIMSSYTSHFGLGSSNTIDSLYIYWPSGNTDRLINPPVDTTLMITEGQFCLPMADFTYTSPGLNVTLTATGDVGITDWTWTFEDGTIMTGNEVTYAFPNPGLYAVCLDTDGSCGPAQSCQIVSVQCTTLEAFFTHQSDGLDLSFEDFSLGGPSQWTWDFGDGNFSNEQSPNYGYAMPGNYFVCLTVENDCGNAGFCEFIQVECGNVTTAFDKEINDLEVEFIDFSSAGTTSWAWDFGDGNISDEQNPTHSFAAPGTYEVCLSIDGVCGSGETCESISVSCSVPESSFLAFSNELDVNFQDNSLHVPTQWAWDFGDGNTSSEQSPMHTYDLPGIYTSCLIVSNVCGIDTFCRDLIITCNAPEAGYDILADGLAYTFTDTSSNQPTERLWIIDGEDSFDLAEFDYQFAAPGDYEVCLQVSSICGADTLCQIINVNCAEPQAAYSFSSNELIYTFTDTSSGGPTDWEWYIDDQFVSNAATFDYTFSDIGIYDICLISSSICGSDTLCEPLQVSCTIPDADFTYNISGLSVDFTDASTHNPTGWQWLIEDALESQENTFSYTFSEEGTYEVCMIAGSLCGSDTICQMITLDCLPPVSGFDIMLNGLSANFSDQSTNAPSSWIWTVNGQQVGYEASLDYQFPSDGFYEVCLTVNNDCESDQSCEMLTVNCNPVAAAFDTSSNQLEISFTNMSSPGAVSWLWDFGDGNTSTGQHPQHAYTSPGDYTVCLTAINECDDTNQSCMPISVSCFAPEASFSSASNLLVALFDDNSTNNPNEWLWDFGDGNSSTQQNPQHLYSSAGTYTVCLTASSICGSEQICQDITIVCPVPTAGFEVIIDGLTVSLTDTSQNNPTLWNWAFGDGNTSDTSSPTHTFDAPGQYIICLTVGSSCGNNQTCKQISVSCAAPEPAFDFSTDELNVSFQDLSINSPSSWLWEFGDGTSSPFPNPEHSYSQPGNYTVCLTANSVCGSNTICQEISVNCTAPLADFSYSPDELTLSFTDNSLNDPSSWLWTFGDGTSSSLPNPQHTFDTPGTYQICLQSSSICGSHTICQMVEVNCQAPQAAFTFTNEELNVSLTDNSSGLVEEWLWTFGDGNSATSANPTHTYTNPGAYTICLETSSICGSTQSCQVITINCTAPLATFTSNANQLEISFTDISQNTPTEWAWDFGDGNTSSEANPTHQYAEPGIYTICLEASSVCGSSQFCQMLEVTCTAPQANFIATADELSISFNDISDNNPTQWAWTFGDGGSSTDQNPSHTYAFPGNYLVCLTVTSVCGTTQRCELTEVGCNPPQASFAFSTDELSVNFQDESTEDAVAWLWDFGDGNGSTESDPSHTYNAPGSYEACLTVSSICGNTTFCETLEVSCAAPISNFDYQSNGLEMIFENLSTNGANSWLWDFGDGNTSTEEHPVYVYTTEGTYTICLTAISQCGENMSCQQLTLSPNDITTISKDEVQIAIYPNPTRDYSLLEVNKTGNAIHYEWQILNSIGQLIEKGLGTTSKGTDLAVHNLEDGVYWVRVYMDGQVASIKMVKVK